MKSTSRALVGLLPVILTGLMGGCSSGAHTTASPPPDLSHSAAASRLPVSDPPTYLAQVPTCWNTVSCCVQKYPLTPLQNCGVDSVQAAKILKTIDELNEATQTATLKGVDVPERGEERDDGEERPDWRDFCIEQYNRCIDLSWTGDCSDCVQRCKGQRGKWPSKMCGPPEPRRRR